VLQPVGMQMLPDKKPDRKPDDTTGGETDSAAPPALPADPQTGGKRPENPMFDGETQKLRL